MIILQFPTAVANVLFFGLGGKTTLLTLEYDCSLLVVILVSTKL